MIACGLSIKDFCTLKHTETCFELPYISLKILTIAPLGFHFQFYSCSES